MIFERLRVVYSSHATLEDFFLAGQGTDSGTFTGVLLWDLIQEAQVITDPAQKNDLLRKAVLITGSDCYETVYAMGELAPQYGGTHQVIVAFKRDDQLLGDREGMARIINPGDSYQCSSDPRAHFGLGPVSGFDAIRVLWPDGRAEVFPAGEADRVLVVRRGEGREMAPEAK